MRRYLIFVTAAIGLLMYSIDSTVVAVAFPDFIKDLATNVLWGGMDYLHLFNCDYNRHAPSWKSE